MTTTTRMYDWHVVRLIFAIQEAKLKGLHKQLRSVYEEEKPNDRSSILSIVFILENGNATHFMSRTNRLEGNVQDLTMMTSTRFRTNIFETILRL